VLLPGVTTLERLVARVRERAAARLWQQLTQSTNAEQQAHLDTLLQVPAGEHTTLLDRLRRAPSRVSGPGLVAALPRVDAMRALGVGDLPLDHLPLNRLRALARYAAAARAQAISRMAPERRTATLLAFAHAFERTAMDDAIDVLDGLVSDLVRGAQNEGETERLRTLHALDNAALQRWDALHVRLDHTVKPIEIRPHPFARVPRHRLLEAGATVEQLTRPPDDNYDEELAERYQSVRRFLPTLLRTVSFESIQAGQPLLEAWALLRQIEHQRHPDMRQAPLEGVPRAWRRLGKPPRQAAVDRPAYTLCPLARLQESLRRRDVFVARSERWGNPRIKLLHGVQWDATRSHVCRALNRHESPESELEILAQQLDAAYQRTAANFPTNAAVRIEPVKGRDTLTLTGLDKLDEPPSLLK